jgi:DNA-binding response OmpR family regulator
MCPHCGYDLLADQPVIINNFAMLSARSPLSYMGKPIKLTHAERSLCWTLMKAFPRPVRRDVILDRMDSEALGNVIDVHLSRIRKKLRTIGAPVPFVAAHNAVAWTL